VFRADIPAVFQFIAFLVLLSLLDYTTHTLHSESSRRASVLDVSEIIRHSVVYLLENAVCNI